MFISNTANADPPPDHAKEIQQTISEWAKQQLVDTIKGIFKTHQDEQEKSNKPTFGVTILQIGFLACYGWLTSFIMPVKIAELMRTTALMACIQIVAEYMVKLVA